MPHFRYRALTRAGEVVIGEVEAPSREEVLRRIEYLGHLPIETEAATKGLLGSSGWNVSKANARDITIFLRQDPDVIMVGEMRDAETAHIGVHAALTGHLVLTTLHTNTAAGAIPRMIDMGLESFLLASSVRAIIGQRLVRVLCEHCRERHELTAQEITADYRYDTLGFKAGETVYRPKGCDYCANIGFRGRKGVFEVMEVGPELRRAIGPKTDAADLEAVARREGMTTMTDDGVAKCRAGITTLDEVFRVTMSL